MKRMRKKTGTALIIAYFVIMVLIILGISYTARIIVESRVAERHKRAAQALCLAEAGIERTMYNLRLDFENDPGVPSWTDGDINGIACGPDIANFYSFPLGSTALGTGSYSVELQNVAGTDDEIWIKATGTVGDINKSLLVYANIRDFSPWQHAIFGGTGSTGTLINGNVDIRGSVIILGDGLESTDYAIDMVGDGNIGNNYDEMAIELENKIPPCPTVIFNGESVESLGATVRIKRGQAALSGSATLGNIDVSGNDYKETVDGVFITDGYAGNKGAVNVFSDNGTANSYDLGDSIHFPSLSDPYLTYATHQDYLYNNALVISDPAKLNQLSNIKPDSNFSYIDPLGKGSISMDGSGNLSIDGIVYIDGGDLGMREKGPADTINYTGTGSILVTGDVEIGCSLVTQGNNSFPSNIIGIMTPGEIMFTKSQIDVMGIFYAEDTITSTMQTDVTGTFVSNYFDMGIQVPNIFQVPDIINNLPAGMINQDPIWIIRTVSWQEL